MTLIQDHALSSAILETVRTPLLALDEDLRVEIANDAFLRLFRVNREETVGRLVYDLGNGQWDIPELRRLLGEILPEKRTVTDHRVAHEFERIGRRIMHVSARQIERPDDPDMILLAMSDDTERESLRAELIGRIEIADKLIDSVREGLLILAPDLRVHSASGSFYETFQVSRAETEGRLVYDLGNGQWDIPELRQLLEEVLPRQRSFDDYQVTHTFDGLGERVMLLNARRLDHQDLILLAIRDITDSVNSRARLTEVARLAHVGVFEADLRAGTAYWSPEMREIVGYPQDEPPPPPPSVVPTFVHPEDAPGVEEIHRKLTDPDGDGAAVHEHRIIRPDGEVRWVRVHGHMEFDKEAGHRRPVRLRGVLLDVTANKAAEARLHESDERQRFLLGLGEALRGEMTPAEVKRVVTRRLCSHLGVNRALFYLIDEGNYVVECDHASGVPSLAGRYAVDDFGALLSDSQSAGDDTIVVSDVAEMHTAAERESLAALGVGAYLAVPLFRDGAFVAGLAVQSSRPRDWTPEEATLLRQVSEWAWSKIEQIRADTALRDSEARLREARHRQHIAAEAAGLGIWEWLVGADHAIWDDGRIYEIFGIPRGSPPLTFDQLVRDFLHPDDREHLERAVAEGLETGSFRAVCRITRASDGARRWIEYSGRREDNPDGADRIIGTIADITERKETEERQTMLMAELDHRVKNILAVVQSITRQSLGRGQAAEQLVGRLDALAQSHAILASSRWEGARFADIVENTVVPYRGRNAERIVTDGPYLNVTPKAAQTLNLALHELVTNAAKYGALSREDGRVAAEWRLAGEGDARRLVFTWQERGGPEIVEAPSHRGFGSRLIERTLAFELGGEVTLDYAREGLRAVMEFPLARLRARNGRTASGTRGRERPAAGDPSILRDKTILVAEDEHLVAQETARVFASVGCRVNGPVATLHEALRIAATDDLDAAVLDINLGGSLIWPAAHALRARGIPLIFTTGYSDTVKPPPEFEETVRIEKPFERELLVSTLAAAVEAGAPDAPA